MFESDDFDQVLSQFNFPEDIILTSTEEKTESNKPVANKILLTNVCKDFSSEERSIANNNVSKCCKKTVETCHGSENISPKHTKRKMLHSYFDHKSKRKFPGPAGLLTGGFEVNKDETICHMELLSQDVDFSQNSLRGDLFESPLWARLQDDLKSWNLNDVDSIKRIKLQAVTGNLRRKAQTVTAVVETVDRSATDPLILLRDITGSIKGTLHRDAWSAFSQYISSEYCALILQKPTILTTGSAFKKHYLNITLSNILAIYSSTIVKDESDSRPLPDNYTVIQEDDFTVIKIENQTIGNNLTLGNETTNGASDIFEELDSIFSDEIF